MIAVIFEVWPALGRKNDYLGIAAALRVGLDRIDGWSHRSEIAIIPVA
jgi:hypothetical protein